MISVINILGREIPLYAICYFGGIGASAAVALLICKTRLPRWGIVYSGVFAMIGSKLFFICVSIRQIIENSISLLGVIKGGLCILWRSCMRSYRSFDIYTYIQIQYIGIC